MSPIKSSTYMLNVGGIPVQVTRKQVKNVNFRVDQQGRACMSVPWNMPRDKVERYAAERREWFSKCIEKRGKNAFPTPIVWATGESASVWGNGVLLDVRLSDGLEYCSWENDAFVMFVHPGSGLEHRRALFERWLIDDMRMRLDDLRPECEERVGVNATSITLRRMKTRWGSCTTTTGRIRLNTVLAERPPECMEMVLVHELCHMYVPNHGPKFRALMDLHCPSWRVWERLLNEHLSQ